MTYQETLYKGKFVLVHSWKSKSGKLHFYIKKYIGRQGCVLREAKNGMLQVKFKTHVRNIPAGCLHIVGEKM